jgi:hypothetical protein
MTVAAVILVATPESALRAVEGVANVRRLADAAWAGGALPVVVVAHDPAGEVATALAGSEAILAEPAPREAGPVGQIVRGIEAAMATVVGTGAALVWPARMGWVDAETVTSLIEAHGVEPAAVLRPAFRGEAGWPALVPVDELPVLRRLPARSMPDEILATLASGLVSRLVELGDPGVTHDLDTPRTALPPFEGPAEPASGHVHEWGAPAADRPDDAPVAASAGTPADAAEASGRGQ